MRVALATVGCKVNQGETEAMQALFEAQGYSIVPFAAEADVYVVNTCSVTQVGEKKSRQMIRRAKRLNPAAIVAVVGCYSQLDPAAVSGIEGVDVVLGTQDRGTVVTCVEQAINEKKQILAVHALALTPEFEEMSVIPADRTRAFLKIQDGCDNFCTYCIIPYTRGPLRSRRIAAAVRETEKLIEAGFFEIVLTGIHLGRYGREVDDGPLLADIVQSVLAVPGVRRLRLGSVEALEITESLVSLMRKDDRLCRHLHLPLQSGEDEILKAMNRPYTTADYAGMLGRLRQFMPDIAITTDVIVGFPGETEQDFTTTCEFVRSMNFSRVHVFPFSARTGTPAAEFGQQISKMEKEQRVMRLQQVAEGAAKKYRERFLGRRVTVLVEECMAGDVTGYSGEYLRVYLRGECLLPGSLVEVEIRSLYQDGLWGEAVD